MLRSLVAAALLVAMTGAWYWALMPAVPAVPLRTGAGASPRRAVSAVPAVRLDDLRAHAVRPALEHGRNPFAAAVGTLGSESPRIPSAAASAGQPASSAAEAVATWPRLELIGVAEGREDGALVRTAIVAGPRGVHHARVGDLIEQVYRVDRIGAGGVEVQLLPEGRTVRLVLRP